MWPDRVSSPGSLTYESGALPTALRGPAAQSIGQPTRKSEVLCSIPGRATFFRFSFR